MEHASIVMDWDGAALEESALVELEIEWEEAPGAEHAGSPLEEAIRRASGAVGGRRGLLIEGAPGSGKSVLSGLLERRLGQPPFDALGVPVRRGARELAVALERNPEAPLGRLPPDSRGLVPIVDGLDELTTRQARSVSAWLERTPGWWIATTRPLSGMRAQLPRAWRLRMAPLSSQAGRRILEARGRSDLAEALFGSLPRRGALVLRGLAETPLMIVLLARVVAAGEPIHELRIHDVYARLFDGMLEQALQAGRLPDSAARLLRQLREAIIGELALEWLRAPSGSLDRTVVSSVLEQAGFRGAELAELAEALEFGHLLVPMGDGFDFAHRTIAEWAAAMALRRRVSDRLRQRARESGRSLERYERASIEGEQLDPFLQDRPLLRCRWEQLLRFYAPFVEEPLALFENIVGARSRSTWPPRVGDALAEWELAGAFMAGVTWTRPADARAVWGIAVRRWLLDDLPRSSQHRRLRSAPEVVVEIAAAVAQHLPESLDELVAIAAQTDEQRAALATDPLILLLALPADRAGVLAKLLRGGDRDTQLAILEWHEAREAPVASDVVDRLIRELPAEVEAADQGVDPQRRVDLRRLEELTWNAAVRTHASLCGPAARKRMQEHPGHLRRAIEHWFARPANQRSAWDTSDTEDDQTRRQLLALCLGDGVEYLDRYRAEQLLRALHPSRLDAVAGELFDSLPPGHSARGAFVALMARTGVVPAAATEAVQAHRVAEAEAEAARRASANDSPPWRPPPKPVDPVVTRFNDMAPDLPAIVTLALETVDGDVHEIYGTPGSPGAGSREPEDLDWGSIDLNADIVRAVIGAVDRALEHDPESWRELYRLLAHPSQSLRLAVFERCAARSAPYDIIPLAIEALEQHARHDKTRYSGQWRGFLFAAHSGSGNINVEVPDIRSQLARAVYRRLTSAHRELVESLARHDVPWLRGLAAAWCRELGDPTWVAILEPLISDAHATVVRAAVDSILVRAPERVDACVLRADRSRWTAAHDAEIFELQLSWSPATLISLIDEAIARCVTKRRGVFDGCPSPVEGALQRGWTDADSAVLGSHVLRWAASPEPRVRAACTRVGVTRGILPVAPLVPLLESKDVAERTSALECITWSGEGSCAERVHENWHELLLDRTWSLDRLHLDRPDLEDRLLWALGGAPVELASLLALVADQIPFDHEQMVDMPRGKEIVARVIAIVDRWGSPGVDRLLDLLDDRQVEEHHKFCALVEARAHRDPAFRSHLEARAAARKPASIRILEDLQHADRERDLDGLLAALRRDVFPHDWATLSARTLPELPSSGPIKKHTILFLAANPSGIERLALDQEARAIRIELERAGHRDRFELVTWWAAEPNDLLRELRKLKPTVVHFSGRGGQDVAGEHGLFLQGPDGRARFVSAGALEEAFGAAGRSVKLVVLNACYSELQAEALLAHVDCVVGMRGSIHEAAARSFAIGFYGALGEREAVTVAYNHGRAAISLEGLRDGDSPQLKVRAGVDPSRLVLAMDLIGGER